MVRTGSLATAALDLLWRSLLIGLPVLLSGCHPGLVEAPAAAATATAAGAQDVTPATVSVDLTSRLNRVRSARKVTQDQRVNVHLDLGKRLRDPGELRGGAPGIPGGPCGRRARGIGKTRSHEEALAHRRMGNALDRLGRFAQAEVHYKKAIRLSPKDPKVWNDAGYSYYLQGRWADAERTLKTAAKPAPRTRGSRRTSASCWPPRAVPGRAAAPEPVQRRRRSATPTSATCSRPPARSTWLASSTFRPSPCQPSLSLAQRARWHSLIEP